MIGFMGKIFPPNFILKKIVVFWRILYIEAPCTKVQGIFHARKMSIDCSSLANPRSKLRGMRSLSMLKLKLQR
jgi:hypothetical protein